MNAEVHDLTAGYALDALEQDERDAYERHLPGCGRCQEDLAAFWEVASALAADTAGPAPSPELRDRILESARAEKQTIVPLEPRRRVAPLFATVTGVAAAVAIGLGIYSLSLSERLDDTRAALSAQQSVASVLADPKAKTVAMKSGSGRLIVAGDGSAVLVLDALAGAPSGKTYQAWVIEGKTPVSAGTFEPKGGRAIVRIPEVVAKGAVVAVTVEKAGGASTPTLPTLAASDPV